MKHRDKIVRRYILKPKNVRLIIIMQSYALKAIKIQQKTQKLLIMCQSSSDSRLKEKARKMY